MAITLVAIVHAIPDADDPHAIVARLLDAVPPGSYLALSHMAADLIDPDTLGGLKGILGRTSQQALTYRTREQVCAVLRGHGPGRTGNRAGRGMAAVYRDARHHQVIPVVRGGA